MQAGDRMAFAVPFDQDFDRPRQTPEELADTVEFFEELCRSLLERFQKNIQAAIFPRAYAAPLAVYQVPLATNEHSDGSFLYAIVFGHGTNPDDKTFNILVSEHDEGGALLKGYLYVREEEGITRTTLAPDQDPEELGEDAVYFFSAIAYHRELVEIYETEPASEEEADQKELERREHFESLADDKANIELEQQLGLNRQPITSEELANLGALLLDVHPLEIEDDEA